MYIKKVAIENIRSIKHLSLVFPRSPGWHVLIGDNGAGKSTIVKAISMALVGPYEGYALRTNFASWVRKGESAGSVMLVLGIQKEFDSDLAGAGKSEVVSGIKIDVTRNQPLISLDEEVDKKLYAAYPPEQGWFSAAFGPYRRFSGGSKEWSEIWLSYPKLAAHLSAFEENVALTESLEWLKKLDYQRLENEKEAKSILKGLMLLVNDGGLLPQRAKIVDVSSKGIFIEGADGKSIEINQLSDGFRSILSLTFELLRQMVKSFGAKMVFQQINRGKMWIDVPGVVLIDEVDAHLHPTWQTRIGQWFLKYFPNIQFIVTTHSPLVCRAAEKGSIWRLPTPGADERAYEVTGPDRDRLIYGNVLEAMGTQAFGKQVERSETSQKKLERLADLETKHSFGKTSQKEEDEMMDLRKIFTTDDTINL